ncbi:hypothetical protein D6779_05155, partial [Candidatus Parcubacteria bacterium]
MANADQLASSYTVRHFESRTAQNGHPYLRLILENAYENITANCWSGTYIGPESYSVGEIVHVSGRRKTLDYRELVDIYQAELIDPRGKDALISIARSSIPCPDDLIQLIGIAGGIESTPLREFIYETFANRDFALAFITLPASSQHHHNHPGGLLRHSLECVETVQRCVRRKDHRD